VAIVGAAEWDGGRAAAAAMTSMSRADENPDIAVRSIGLRTAPWIVPNARPNLHDGHQLIREFARTQSDYLPGAVVWMASPSLELGVSASGRSRVIRSRRIILATGAFERPFPIPAGRCRCFDVGAGSVC